MTMIARRAEDLALVLVTVIGLAAFLYPVSAGRSPSSSASDALFIGLICAAVAVVLILALQTNRLSTRLLAVLAALVSVDAVLRLPVVIGLAGFSPIFFLMLAGGFAMGPSFGFALGSLTLLVSAALTAGFGPWLPYQMLASGWVGMGAGIVGRLVGSQPRRTSLVWLAIYGGLSGFAYGILLDLWEWPFLLAGGSSPISFAPGLSLADLVRRFAAFYLATSFVYDAFRAAGNLLLVALLGAPVISGLLRFRMRFLVDWSAAANIAGDARTAS